MSDKASIQALAAELELKLLYQELVDNERLGHDTSRLRLLIREATIRAGSVFEAVRRSAYSGTGPARSVLRRPARACCKGD